MSFAHLDRDEAFGPGCELWIVADPASSRAAALLDWRLNFLAARASARKPKVLSDQLERIAAQWDYEPPRFSVPPSTPLLIESGRFVPCRSSAMIQWTGDAGAWAKQARAAWERMGQPKTRVFPPQGLAASAFEAAWERSAGSGSERGLARAGAERGEPVEIVPDQAFGSRGEGEARRGGAG